MRIQIQQIGEEMFDELKLNEIVQQIQLLKQLNICQGKGERNNLENQLNFMSENLNKGYEKINREANDNYYKTKNQILENLQLIKKEIESTYKNLIDNQLKLDFQTSEEIRQFPQIHNQISEGRDIEYSLLYQGTRDGLNGQAYWAKCNLQYNLLTIMTSKNGNKFGGYSLCQLNQQLNSLVQNHLYFNTTKRKYTKLKMKEQAILCNPNYGPIYGFSDIQVQSNLQGGHSKYLGQCYDISNYDIVDKANHIFGSETPQLQEIKVYKIIFK